MVERHRELPERIHLVGAGGSGMSALAKLLSQLGHHVTGSDLKPGPALAALEDLGLEVWSGNRPDAMEHLELVVSSSAVPDDDPELTAARSLGIPTWRRPDLLAALTRSMPALGVTGTHGKTTSTALMVTALRALGRDPSFVVGGELIELGTNAHLGEPELFVLEADEAFGTFLELRFDGLLVTNVEPDHLDHYGTVERLEAAFEDVVSRVEGPVLVGIEDPGGRRLAELSGATGYGTSDDATWRISDLSFADESTTFVLTGPGTELEVSVPRPGSHVAHNAAGVLALLGSLGFDAARAAEGIGRFGGVRRRFELRGKVSGVTIVDDYAHHPTEVAANLAAARAGGWRRVWAVFQPHRYSRTADLHRAFGPAFQEADRVVITDVYGAGETPQPGVTGRLIADAVTESTGRPVTYVAHRADLAEVLAGEVEEGDLVLTLGAGDITLLPDELSRRLEERRR